MYKSIIYDRPIKKRNKPNKYQPEFDALHDFVSSEHKNMLIEYDSGGVLVTVHRY